MTNPLRRPEFILVIGLFAAFAALALVMEQKSEEATVPNRASSFNPAPHGLEALYLLLHRIGLPVERLEAPYSSLDATSGLVVIAEPLVRNPTPDDMRALSDWVRRGNTCMYLAGGRPQPFDPEDPLYGDVETVPASHRTEHVSARKTELLRDAQTLDLDGPVRLRSAPGSPWQVDLPASTGDAILERPFGLGRLIAVAGIDPANGTIANGDDALLFVNVANDATAGRSAAVFFDEYHQGIGFEVSKDSTRSALSYAPLGLRLFVVQMLALLIATVLSANITFGPRKTLHSMQRTARGHFVTAVALLLSRSGAADAAIEVIYRELVDDIVVALGVPPELPQERVAQLAAERFKLDPAIAAELFTNARRASEDSALSEGKALALAGRLDEFRRSCGLVRHAA